MKAFVLWAGMAYMPCSCNKNGPVWSFWLVGTSTLVRSLALSSCKNHRITYASKLEKRSWGMYNYFLYTEISGKRSQRMWKYFLKFASGTERVHVNSSCVPLVMLSQNLVGHMYLQTQCILWKWQHDFGCQLSTSARPVKIFIKELFPASLCYLTLKYRFW